MDTISTCDTYTHALLIHTAKNISHTHKDTPPSSFVHAHSSYTIRGVSSSLTTHSNRVSSSPVRTGVKDLQTPNHGVSDVHTLVLKTDGTVYGTGKNSAHELGVGDGTNRVKWVQAKETGQWHIPNPPTPHTSTHRACTQVAKRSQMSKRLQLHISVVWY